MSAYGRTPDEAVLAGVDAGATKTVAVAVRPDGAWTGRAEADGANPKRHGLDTAADRIAGAVLRAADGTPDLVLVAGAGIDRPEHARALETALEAALVRGLAGAPDRGDQGRLAGARIFVLNDTLAVLRAGTPDAVGIVVPVSTGGNVIGRAADGRVTDRGHGIFGGGYVLGALAVRAARRGLEPTAPAARAARPGREPTPSAVGRVSPRLAAAVEAANLAWRGRRPAPEAARLGAAVVAAAQAGDPYPVRMVDRWCARVESAVREEVQRLDLGGEPVVILYGGLLDASPWLGERLRDAVRRGAPGARIRGLDGEPVGGAVLLALDAWGGHPVRWDFVPRR
jgi:N-acetylglucosamine kinase-like BadF-type ATPase